MKIYQGNRNQPSLCTFPEACKVRSSFSSWYRSVVVRGVIRSGWCNGVVVGNVLLSSVRGINEKEPGT